MMGRGVSNAGMSLKPIHTIRIEKQCHPCSVPDNLITSKTKADIPHFNEMVEDGIPESRRGNRRSNCTG